MNCRRLIHQPAVYRIRISGRLGSEWSQRLQGMAVTTIGEGPDPFGDPQGPLAPIWMGKARGTITELVGLLPDQAALMGVLQKLYLNGAVLLSMDCLSSPERFQ